jgi:cytochrome c-type biogenesis protein CcmI
VVIWIAALLLIVAVALFVAAPLGDHVSNEMSTTGGVKSQRREHEHALAVQALRELEFDHAMGKLDGDDYHALRKRLEIRALAAMGVPGEEPLGSSLDAVAPLGPSSQPVAGAPNSAINFCSRCRARFALAHNFCPNCGAARSVTAAGDSR